MNLEQETWFGNTGKDEMWNIKIFLKSCRGPPPPPFDLSEKFQYIWDFLTCNLSKNDWNRLIPEISATLVYSIIGGVYSIIGGVYSIIVADWN